MGTISISLAAVLLLLLANAFFVAAEFALVKARRSRLETRAAEGSSAAQLTVRMQGKMEPYLAACQLGITMASLGLGWIGEPAVAALLEPVLSLWALSEETIDQIAFVVGFLVFSSLHIVLGEQVPKSLAIRQPEPVTLMASYPLQLFYVIAYPLTWLLDRASRNVLRIWGVQEGTHAELLTLEEIKGVVASSEAHGKIPTDRAAMIRNLIEVDDRPVGWVMIPRNQVTVLNLMDTSDETLTTIRESRHSRFPLIGGATSEDLIGLVLAKDLYVALLQGHPEPWANLRDYSREPLVIPESQTVSRAFETLRAEREHLAIVVDEYGQLVGIVTLEDLLEEVVGEIMDETDAAEYHYTIQALGDGRWLVDGGMPLSDAQRELGLTTEFSIEANTISGLIIERLAKIPAEGDRLREGELLLTVKRVEHRRIIQVLVERQETAPVNA
jgi:CBS domain containing-hemolysin-like protein